MMVLVAAQIALGLIFFMIVMMIIGQLSVQRDEQQNAVDAVNFASAIIAKHEGISAVCDNVALNRLVRENLGAAYELECDMPVEVERDGVDRLRFTSRVVSRYDNPFRYDDGRVLSDPQVDRLRGTAVSDITQAKLSEVELPKVVFVLDYSGSMGPGGGSYGGRVKVEVLREVVNSILDLQLPVEFGLTLFSTNAFGQIDVQFDADQQDIRNSIQVAPGGNTNYEAALASGTNLLRRRGAEKGYLIFITDGVPTVGDQSADPARRVWAAGYTILSVFIGNPADRALLISMSGAPNDQANPAYYFEANDPPALVDAMEAVFKTILCSMGPIDPAPEDPDDMGLLLELADRTEVPLPQVVNPRDLDDQNFYGVHYNPADHYIKLSERACDDILFNNAKVVARHGSPVLLQ